MGFGLKDLFRLGNKLPLKLEGFLPGPLEKFSPVNVSNKLKDVFVSGFAPGGQSVGRARRGVGIGHRHGRFEQEHAHEGKKQE